MEGDIYDMNIKKVELKQKKTRLILSNGSERGDYIELDYILKSLNRIHDGIQLLKTYYPNDEKWSDKYRISEITDKKNINYAWDYEYDDYHPFDIFSDESITIKQFYDIKQHGSDIHLTLTMDLGITDGEIIEIVKQLVPFGRIFLRINHEANGMWFNYNKLNSYQEVSNFFIRCHKIIKRYADNIFTVFNITSDMFVKEKLVKDCFLKLGDNELKEALEISDYWSIDKYVSLHYSWPFEKKVKSRRGKLFQRLYR